MSNNTNLSLIAFNPAVLLSCGIVQVLIASAGIVGNMWLLAATVTSKALHSKTNVLIALLALADLLACAGFIVVSTTNVFDVIIALQNGVFDILGLYNYFELAHCAYINVPITVICNIENALMLVLGLDRLFAVAAPAR